MPPSESAPLLDVQGVSKSFGGVHAVVDCSFTVAEHAIVGLIGPNGAGKSTAIEVVSGFQRPDSGIIRFAERRDPGQAVARGQQARARSGRSSSPASGPT